MDKPEKYTDLMTRFLNDLRDSGRVNMFVKAPVVSFPV